MRAYFLATLLSTLAACGGSESSGEGTGGSSSGGAGTGGAATGGAAGSSGAGGSVAGGRFPAPAAPAPEHQHRRQWRHRGHGRCQPLCVRSSPPSAAGPHPAGCLLTCKALTSTCDSPPTPAPPAPRPGHQCNAAGRRTRRLRPGLAEGHRLRHQRNEPAIVTPRPTATRSGRRAAPPTARRPSATQIASGSEPRVRAATTSGAPSSPAPTRPT
jgi:hypothetical protein